MEESGPLGWETPYPLKPLRLLSKCPDAGDDRPFATGALQPEQPLGKRFCLSGFKREQFGWRSGARVPPAEPKSWVTTFENTLNPNPLKVIRGFFVKLTPHFSYSSGKCSRRWRSRFGGWLRFFLSAITTVKVKRAVDAAGLGSFFHFANPPAGAGAPRFGFVFSFHESMSRAPSPCTRVRGCSPPEGRCV